MLEPLGPSDVETEVGAVAHVELAEEPGLEIELPATVGLSLGMSSKQAKAAASI